jgi:Flp pilus assembly protein TadG
MQCARFIEDRRASVAPIFTLAIISIIGFVGAAVDYSRANSVKSAMQAALDATALAVSKDAQTLTPAQLSQKANSYFTSVFDRPEAKNVQVTSQFTNPQAGTFNVHVAGTATVDATFAKVLGQSQLNVGAMADVTWGIKKLELALALDNTGSMASNGKIQALKQAAHNLLTTLQAAATQPGDVKVAIIPFDTMVNIGASYANQSWIDFSVKNINPNQWEGCVIDRDKSHDAQDTTPTTTNYHTLYPASQCGALVTAQPLSTDWTALHNKVDQMNAAGNTNVTIGLVWAWHALTANLPFTQAASPAPDLDKVIVLLTDGENTQNRWSTKSSSIDARTTLACNNIKATGIKVYTVRVIEGNATLLKNCATTPNMYYDVDQASQLNDVFSSIAQALASLRISK